MIRLEHPRPGGMWAGSEPRLEARVTRDYGHYESVTVLGFQC